MLILAAVLVVLVGFVALVGLIATRAADREKAANPALFEEGGCVKSAGVQGRLEPAACSDPAAVGKVIGVVAGSFAPSAAPCPDATDVAGTSSYLQAVCVRNLQGPHPGDAGQGGGVLRPGDCIVDVDEYSFAPDPEVACAAAEAAYQVLAVVAETDRCVAGTQKVVEVKGSPRPKACAKRHAA
jgi:hypothetical protein